MDPSDLEIVRGKAAWAVKVDVLITDHDGAVGAAAILGVMLALRTTRLPAIRVTDDNRVHALRRESRGDDTSTAFPLRAWVLPVECALVEDSWLVDPTAEEEQLSSGSMLVVATRSLDNADDDDDAALCSCESSGRAPVTSAAMDACVEHAMELGTTTVRFSLSSMGRSCRAGFHRKCVAVCGNLRGRSTEHFKRLPMPE